MLPFTAIIVDSLMEHSYVKSWVRLRRRSGGGGGGNRSGGGGREAEVAQALDVLKQKGPRRLANGVLEWENLDGLLYYKGKLYIPNDNELRGEVVKTCHDSPTTGHPGKHGTIELVQRYYWWPHMAAFIEKYVLGCDKCQRYKSAQHPKALLPGDLIKPL